MKHLFFTMMLAAGLVSVSAQQVSLELTGSSGLIQGAISVVDINGDGNADIVFGGKKGTAKNTASDVYFYQGNGNGSDPFDYLPNNNGLKGGYSLNFFWEDFNGDGKLDLFNSGYDVSNLTGYAKQYLTTDYFTLTGNEPFPVKPTKEHAQGSAVADFDNDGLLDYAHVYEAAAIPHIVRFGDTSSDSVSFRLPITQPNGSPAAQINDAQLTTLDFNNDGLVDLFVVGHIANPSGKYTGLFINNGDRTFTEKKFSAITAGNQATALFADVNGDGLMDLIFSTYASSSSYPLTYYKNNGNGEFVQEQLFTEAYQASSASTFGAIADINNDGYYDLIIAGNNNATTRKKTTAFYLYNPTSGRFDLNETLTNAIPGVNYPAISVIDINNDGILDFALMGQDATSQNRIGVYKNTTFTATNAAPSVPANLQESVLGSKVTFSWGAATDDKTPANSLTYNIYLKNTTTGKYIIHPKANLTTGKRQVYTHGNAFLAKTKELTLPDGNYEWSVQAIDAAYAGGAFATTKTFTIGATNGLGKTEQLAINLHAGNGNITVQNQENVEEIALYNTVGTLINTVKNSNTLSYNAAYSGVYVVKVKVAGQEIVKKIIL